VGPSLPPWSLPPPAGRRIGGAASSALTRELLGWRPVQPGLIEDLDKGHYLG
jgi:hypothetical protein